MNTRFRLTMLAAVFAFIAPVTSTLHAQRLPGNQDKYVPNGTRKCIKPKNQVPLLNGLLEPLACVTPVINVSARSGNESESFVVVNPTNTNNLVAFSNLASENSIFRGYSTNGGATWTRGTVATGVACCDGQAAWDTFGNLFLVYINNSVDQINVILSTDGGVTFSAPVTVGTGNVDQPSIAVGNGSVWVDWNSGGSMVARGAPVTGLGTWGPFNALQSIPSASGSFGGIAVGPGANGGKVIVTYQSPTGGQGPATIYANVDADGLGAGGFGARITVTTTNVGGFDFIPAQNGRSVDAEAGVVWDATGGPFNNRIYLVYTEETVNENNDTDILMRRSTDDGATWSAPVRVNDDATTRSQFLPYVALDRTNGTIAVGFHDCRNDNGVPGSGGTNNTPNDDAEYYATYSTDGGVTFAPNTRLSGGFSNADASNNGIDFGDYVGQTAHANKLYTVWADNANCDGTNANGTLSMLDLYTNTYPFVPVAVVGSAGSTVLAGTCGNPGVINPGATLTVNLCVQNTGSLATTNLVGTLQATGGVLNPSGPQNYGVVSPGGGPVCRSFTFTANAACGATVTASLQVQDGANNLGTLTYTFTLAGTMNVSYSENFDGVTPPALPAGWMADVGVNAAGAPLWQTSNSGTPTPVADSAPNSVFTQDPSNTCDNRVYTSTFMYSGSAQMSCRMNYDLEENSSTVAYDAGVLEISINGGAYTDIIAAGGSWVAGGYNHTGINTGFSNPLLPSRPCWSGVSSGFVTTTVNLPAAGAGQPVKLRWRMGSDSSVSHTGWRVDTVSVSGGFVCAPPAVSAVSRKVHGGAGTFDINLPLTGTPGVECRNGPVSGEYQVVVNFANPVSLSGASVTSGTGNVNTFSASGSTVTVNLTGVTNAQTLSISLSDVSDGTNMGCVSIPMSVLAGDTNGNGTVNASDVSQTKLQSGSAVTGSNFRTDVNANGAINASDVSSVKTRSGTSLP
ncbi:MAG TPA: dockerin type I domain-containing protein [Candidatus Udaeobacter sp.]|jgi:hypothetical protein|nr:dockerin type I domain-containing protein [Candidatus Udaeobacter sp.]